MVNECSDTDQELSVTLRCRQLVSKVTQVLVSTNEAGFQSEPSF